MTVLKQPLDTLRKSAKVLAAQVKLGDEEACQRAARVLRDFSQAEFGLMRALHVVAVEHGFRSWSDVTTTSAEELYSAISKVRRNRRFDLPTQERIRQILREHAVGIPEDILTRPIHILSLCPIVGGSSASLAVAQQIAHENARRRLWGIHLGHYGCVLTEGLATRLVTIFEREGIPFWKRNSLGRYWAALKTPIALPQAYKELCETFGTPTT